MDKAAYFRRIGYEGSADPSVETLRAIQRAHMRSVPFENLDMQVLRRPIHMDEGEWFDKIVNHRRGGFCYELNGLFAALLRELGFDVSLLSARVVGANGAVGPEFDHLTLRVELEERWLADAGFGESFQEPLRLDVEGPQEQESGTYLLGHEGDDWTMSILGANGKWKPTYHFSLAGHPLEDFAAMCQWHQVAPESAFRKNICTLPTATGRVTISERRLIVVSDGHRQMRKLETDEAYAAALKEYFGIVLE